MDQLRLVRNEFTPTLTEKGLVLQEGWNEAVAEAVINGSKEEAILRFTPNDALRRFTDHDAAYTWALDSQKNRRIYTLANEAIGGLIWFSQESYGDATYTFAIRLYDCFRGQGLASVFLQATHRDFATLTDNPKIWLSTDTDNAVALGLYENNGYITVAEADGRVHMIRS